ncbi:MAG: pyridoxal phosphate-dependent aminotransferase, partial [Alphaproteobacteria bacterium]
FYLWCDVSALTNDSAAFSAAMLEGAGIAATTGLDFDRGRGGRFLRFSYCGREADMATAPERLARWLGR